MDRYTEQDFPLEHLTLRARVWGEGGGRRVLALHGWLDNCASFNYLASNLPDAHVVALDMAGHGLSDHRNTMSPYNIWEDVVEIFAVADHLGWTDFTLIGHSRGAIVSVIAAGTFPHRISNVVLLDGIWPEPATESAAPEQLARSVRKALGANKKRATIYSDYPAAVNARVNSALPVTPDAAEALAQRGVKEVADGFVWRADPNLKLPSSFRLTGAQINAFTEAVTANMLLVMAEQGIVVQAPELLDKLAYYPNLQCVRIPGGHHFHMEESKSEIASLVSRFLGPC